MIAELFLKNGNAFTGTRLVKSCMARLKIYLVRLNVTPFSSLFFFFFFGSSTLRIKMRDKPNAAGRTLAQPSAELQVSICKRNGRCSVVVASTSCTLRYRLFNAAQPRGQTIVCRLVKPFYEFLFILRIGVILIIIFSVKSKMVKTRYLHSFN